MAKVKYNEGQPCEHTGCLNHLTHPCEGCGRIGGKGIIYELEQLDFPCTIEALQQEVKGWEQRYDELDAGHSKLFKDFCRMKQENERLQIACDMQLKANLVQVDENNKLQAQNGAMVEAIRYVLYHLKRGGESWIIEKLEPFVSGTATYHNPTDVEALKQAREALTIVSDYYSNVLNMAAWKTVKEALAAIDEIGGREDV